MTVSCLGHPTMVEEQWEPMPAHPTPSPKFKWEPVSPELQPIMKDFHLAVKNAHQSLVKQASQTTDVSICGIMKTTLTMVIKARQALDCGGAAAMMSSSDYLGKTDHKTILEAVRSCTGSDDLCLIKKLGNLANTSSPGPVCSAVREVESGLQTALSIFCHEELGSTGCWGCAAKVLSAAAHCIGREIEACVKDVIGAGSNCYSCVCEFITC